MVIRKTFIARHVAADISARKEGSIVQVSVRPSVREPGVETVARQGPDEVTRLLWRDGPNGILDAKTETSARAKSFDETFPDLARAREQREVSEAEINLRLDQRVIDYFRATGDDWQGRVNDVPKRAAGLDR